MAAFELCSRLEGIIPALEPAHALARVMDIAPQKPKDHLMVVNLSGRGDKDLASVAAYLKQRAGCLAATAVISRQKIVGWILIVVSVAYIAYFLRVRLFTPGPDPGEEGMGAAHRLDRRTHARHG